MPFCVVPQCHLNDKKMAAEGVSFHCFPKKEDLKRKWVAAIINENINSSDVVNINVQRARVCSRHFRQADYSISCQGQRRRLLLYAVPSVIFDENNKLMLEDENSLDSLVASTPKTGFAQSSLLLPGRSSHFTENMDVLHLTEDSTKSPLPKKQRVSASPLNIRNVPLSPIGNITHCENISKEDYSNLNVCKKLFSSSSDSLPPEQYNVIPLAKLSVAVQTNQEMDAPKYEDKCTQATPIIRERKPKTNTRKQRRTICKMKKKIEKLIQKVGNLLNKNKELQQEKKDMRNIQFEKLKEAAKETHDITASFLLEQVLAFGKKSPPYVESTLKICCLLYKKSPSAYTFLREMGVLHLPHRITLKRFIGHASGEDGITNLVIKRLKTEFSKITNEHEKLGSLVMDEMSIQSKLIYDRNLDLFFGATSKSLNVNEEEVKLATHLLCFVFQGISTKFRMPVAYFYTANITGEQLYMLTRDVIKAIEGTGFVVLRLVADNAKINTAAFAKFGNGTLTHEVQHPNDSNRKLFIAFDQSHVIKNLRNQFLARTFVYIGLLIKSEFIRWLYNLQKGSLVKPVRFLTRKVVYPTNFEKMNVLRAVQIFSEPLTSALKTILKLHLCDKEVEEDLEVTIYFMEMIYKWYQIHDISNLTHGVHSRNENKLPFYKIDDERLEWLEYKFLPFIKQIQDNACGQMEKLTKETFEALTITTNSTVALIKYLLHAGFHYVLTRKLSSDIVELTFCHIRGSGGYNDQMDARQCTLAIEQHLKLGILKASKDGNVKETLTCKEALQQTPTVKIVANEIIDIQSDLNIQITNSQAYILSLIERAHHNESCQITIRNCTVALIGGYIVRVAEEHTDCWNCLEKLIQPNSEGPLYFLIKAQDHGGLKYPSRLLTCMLKSVLDFVQSSIKQFPKRNTLQTYVQVILPFFKKPLTCDEECKNTELPKLLLEKFIRPLLYNYARDETDLKAKFKKLNSKPLNRKVVKV